jgi:hypothetical protein
MPKKSKIEKECESCEANIRKIVEEEIRRIEETVKKDEEEARCVGEEIENSLKEKEVKRKS